MLNYNQEQKEAIRLIQLEDGLQTRTKNLLEEAEYMYDGRASEAYILMTKNSIDSFLRERRELKALQTKLGV